ncbi:hypothetical protein GGF46_004999 [Coemansia sp. RSA 552]|nr:hypothetical protein GGF46_004999 [Coemansia sp. RSA 552]
MYSGYQIAAELLQHKGKHFKAVCVGYAHENHLVHLLKQKGASCVKMSIVDGEDAIADVYRKADVVVVVPPVCDDRWGEGACIFVSAAAKAQVKGLVLCSKVGAGEMRSLPALAPLHKLEEAFDMAKGQVGVASLLRCSLHIDLLWLFRRQIAKEHGICLASKHDARFAPLAGADAAAALCHMLVDPKVPAGIYNLTGPQPLTFECIARSAASLIDEEIHFKQVSREEMIQYLTQHEELCRGSIHFVADMLEAVSQGILDKHTDDLVKLLGKKPMTVDRYLEKNAGDFRP